MLTSLNEAQLTAHLEYWSLSIQEMSAGCLWESRPWRMIYCLICSAYKNEGWTGVWLFCKNVVRVNIKKEEEFLKLKGNTIGNCGIRTNGYKSVLNKFCICLEITINLLTVRTERYLKPLKAFSMLGMKQTFFVSYLA